VMYPTVATYDWTERDRDFETENLGILMGEHDLADTKIMKGGI